VIKKVNHFSIVVKDLDQVVAFFRDLLGLTDIWPIYEYEGTELDVSIGLPGARAHCRIAKIEVGETIIEFMQYLAPPGRELKGAPNDVGTPHIAFEVDDLDGMYASLKQRGVRFKSEPLALTTDERHPMYGWREVDLWGPEHDDGESIRGAWFHGPKYAGAKLGLEVFLFQIGGTL
jgi:catechol 2,3-dioxygenase-like lactoylglutathione lyase family enzyme